MKELKISDLQYPYTTNDSILLSAINKMIKQNNRIEKWINRQEEPCGDFIPNEMQNGAVNMEYINIDDIAIIEKEKPKQSWQKKLEEADNLEIISLKAKDILSSFEKESIWQLKECNKFKIDLYKQVISKLIKDNKKWEESANRYCKRSHVNYNKLVETQYQLEQLQQKHPDQESDFYKRYRQTKEELQQLKKKKLSKKCMTWLQENINKIGIELYCREILKYFKEK